MDAEVKKLYGAVPTLCRQNVSLNILLSEKSDINDGIKKELNIQFPKDYYNSAYHTRIFKRIMFNKFICIKQLL